MTELEKVLAELLIKCPVLPCRLCAIRAGMGTFGGTDLEAAQFLAPHIERAFRAVIEEAEIYAGCEPRMMGDMKCLAAGIESLREALNDER